MALPLCPCRSEELYEECCYKIKGEDGEPLFFKGSMVSDDKGNWHPLPNVRLDVAIVAETTDRYRDFAKNLAGNSDLKTEYHSDFIDTFAIFFSSYEKLLTALTKPQGKGVAFQIDSLEARESWKQFLFNGRILLDFIGLHCRGALGLNQEIGGLNTKKFESLLKILKKAGKNDAIFLVVEDGAKVYKQYILDFIDMRNREKTNADTITKFPAIDSEFGLKNDGELTLDGKAIPMIKFVKTSYESIFGLTRILLNISND